MAQAKGGAKAIAEMSDRMRKEFVEQKNILSFDEYIELVMQRPRKLCRNSAEYLKAMIDHYGVEERTFGHGEKSRQFRLFERKSRRTKPPIIGQDAAHESIYSILEQFVRQGRIDKLILLHGPNGSSKSSTAEALASALEEYSRSDEGAIYRFNWIFPTDKVGYDGLGDDALAKRIGFAGTGKESAGEASFARLADEEVMCKIVSEMKENPIFLLPSKERVEIFRKAVKATEKRDLEESEIPPYLEEGAIGSKSKRIFDSLLAAYQGDVRKVLRHVQVERFFFSSRYRVGIATVEPQMHMDAQDRQLTMDRHVQNLPSVLQNIRIFEPSGELIDANRGFVEFADLLKRPLDAFKYLLTSIETMSLNLTSGMADLDLVMMGSANEKHLDAFKSSPDWPSFKGRFELVRVPYLLKSCLEKQIYQEDIKSIERSRKLGPHALELLAKWAVLTRLRQPDPESFAPSMRELVKRLSPYNKLALYDGEDPADDFSELEKNELKKTVGALRREGQTTMAYEGRFGASPRELKAILYFASQAHRRDSVSALSIFEEIETLITDRSVYEYLQFEPSQGYHDCAEFLKYIRQEYARRYNREFLMAMNLFDEDQYAKAFDHYLLHVVAFIRKESIYNDITHKREQPDEKMMEQIEGLMGASGEKVAIRESVMAKVASWSVDNPSGSVEIRRIFADELKKIARNIYESKREYIEKVTAAMLMLESPDYKNLPADLAAACETTYANLETRFGYTRKNAWETLVFARRTLS
jgi:serine protein kinase